MGTNPRDSVLNKYLQSWDCHNLFVVGANVFPHNSSYNPTGPVGALAYWTADAIKNKYVKNPGPLVAGMIDALRAPSAFVDDAVAGRCGSRRRRCRARRSTLPGLHRLPPAGSRRQQCRAKPAWHLLAQGRRTSRFPLLAGAQTQRNYLDAGDAGRFFGESASAGAPAIACPMPAWWTRAIAPI